MCSVVRGKKTARVGGCGLSMYAGGGSRTHTPLGQTILSRSWLPFHHSGAVQYEYRQNGRKVNADTNR